MTNEEDYYEKQIAHVGDRWADPERQIPPSEHLKKIFKEMQSGFGACINGGMLKANHEVNWALCIGRNKKVENLQINCWMMMSRAIKTVKTNITGHDQFSPANLSNQVHV